eukprot:7774251-Heterocapsa_arctica.AAC.1
MVGLARARRNNRDAGPAWASATQGRRGPARRVTDCAGTVRSAMHGLSGMPISVELSSLELQIAWRI